MPLSEKEMLKLYLKDGWIVLRQKGSRVIVGKGSDRETIPMHWELKPGLEHALLKKILRSRKWNTILEFTKTSLDCGQSALSLKAVELRLIRKPL